MNSTIIDDERNTGTPARRALREAVKAASAARSWADAQLEWDIAGPPGIDPDSGSRCACGQDGLMYLYTVANRVTGTELYPIGSTCIVEHFGAAPAMMARMATLRAVAGVTVAMRDHGGCLDLKRDLTPTRIKALAAEGVLGARDAHLLVTLRRRRRPLTLDQHVAAERLLREAVAPALGGDSEAEIVDDPAYRHGHHDGLTGARCHTGAPSAYVVGHHDGLALLDMAGAA
ncbi:hypothetical protein [Gordonia sihwensis]|uniref:hypothetical protein n=1 Tax=Gordonia sihwensis TaxID=173559 RepID=UPI002417565B|nr:hypothetical protein [Gordonia sihwensis]WFN93870.1 hypothetical protein P5P27_04755 [Gordonia sihwensis]